MDPTIVLPYDIFSQIFSYHSIPTLNACVRVNRSWHHQAAPWLYCHVVLSNPLRDSTNFSMPYIVILLGLSLYGLPLAISQAAKLTTLNGDRPTWEEKPPADFEQSFQVLSKDVLPRLHQLSAFSLSMAPKSQYLFEIRFSGLISLIDALPASCVNLEIDTQSFDNRHSPPSGDLHVCNSLRRILHRMQNVRLCLHYVCSALFGEVSTNTFDSTREFVPISLPNIQTLVVNCNALGKGRISRYDTNSLPLDWDIVPWRITAWDSITGALQRLVKIDGSYPPSAKLVVFDRIYESEDRSKYSTFLHSEMISQTTLAYPCRDVASAVRLRDQHLLRTLDGRELLANSHTFSAFTEGQFWKSTICGARLPAPLVATGSRSTLSVNITEDHLSMWPTDKWRRRNPDMCALWKNETILGQRLLDGEISERPMFLSRYPVGERTPPGFVRSGRNGYRLIYRARDPYIPF
ncbi:hypothetical protein AJ80_05424 [Polytolypa hystricis UAMH7299]|uniref:F-box domain-containing protein n=1 Tax=Polytolypa hystricis (strain UAMH7299) TaxID=1447883 RepID=A0A2B7Y2K7_POLH7|nr:hypothetical protein AJ80_05424 [Polytolypa hystricis UAMH7299]